MTVLRLALEDIDLLPIRQPERVENITNVVRHHNLRHPVSSDATRTLALSQVSSSSLELLPSDLDLDALHMTDMYIEDDLFNSELFRTPDLQLTGVVKPPDVYIKKQPSS